MKTLIQIEVTHTKPVPDLEDKISGRAYTLDGVDDVKVVKSVEIPTWRPATEKPGEDQRVLCVRKWTDGEREHRICTQAGPLWVDDDGARMLVDAWMALPNYTPNDPQP